MTYTIKYELVSNDDINDSYRKIVARMLENQNKVKPPYNKKADRCKLICLVYENNIPIALGAIKMKTASDFSEEKANLTKLSEQFDWELGYIFVKKEFAGQGIATSIVRMLLNQYGDGNLMASTEITANPGMVRILEKFGFRHYGNPYPSTLHKNNLGLFLRFH